MLYYSVFYVRWFYKNITGKPNCRQKNDEHWWTMFSGRSGFPQLNPVIPQLNITPATCHDPRHMLRRRKRSNPVAVPKPAWWAVCCDSGWKPSRNIQKPQWWAWSQIFSWISSYPQGWLKSWLDSCPLGGDASGAVELPIERQVAESSWNSSCLRS